ncbi:MAG: Flp pilus assembly complex ATPase component TadA [Deltaproteobacteria bacterium]|nr:Flp pilus assembly complex ATPase component TadA [Deltaproteobacteria bacterium]
MSRPDVAFEPALDLSEALGEALSLLASDVHLQPDGDHASVRFRVDGRLVPSRIRPQVHLSAVEELCAMADLAPGDHAGPAETSVRLLVRGAVGRWRLSRMPGVDGERVCLHRVMSEPPVLEKLGFDEHQLRAVYATLAHPWGVVLFGGPAGSGKTTTFYAALSALDPGRRCVLTHEDVVEADIPGVHQAQSAGQPFLGDGWLRAMLHQDPDVIGLGEIHDLPTAMFAVRGALTGALVLSTAAFNDSPSCVSRLLNLGVEPFLVTSALRLIVCQRLVRLSCQHCLADDSLRAEQLDALRLSPQQLEGLQPRAGFGCERCQGSGVAGRAAIFEVLELTPSYQELVLMGASSAELKSEAMLNGFRTLRQHAIELFVQGRIRASEVLHATNSDEGLPAPPSLTPRRALG